MSEVTNAQIEAVKAGLEARFNGLQDTLEAMKKDNASQSEIDKIHDSIKAQGERLVEFETTHNEAKGKMFHEQLGSFLKANKEKINDVFKAGSGYVEFHPDHDEIEKAVGDIFRANGTIGTVPAWNDVSLPNVMLRDDNPMLQYARTYRTNSASQPYTEIISHEGKADVVAEGGKKPQIDFDWMTKYATPYKVAAYEVLTEEVVQDITRMMEVARDYLKQKHDLRKVEEVYFGTGLTIYPTGATVVGAANAYSTLTGLTGSLANGTANVMDVINAAILKVWSTPPLVDGVPFIPNLAMMNPVDFTVEFIMAKDGNGRPLYPQASLFNKVTIGGVTIVPWVSIPTGKIFVGDMKKYNIGNYIPYFVKIGWINDQLIHNMFTMVGESRFFAYVKSQDEKAFSYSTIATILGDLEVVSA